MAIYSNDPNIGVRAMGYGSYIPNPVSSISYHDDKTRQINQRRSGMRPNSPSVSEKFRSNPNQSADPSSMTARQKAPFMERGGDSIGSSLKAYSRPQENSVHGQVPASVVADGTINKYLDAQAKAVAAIVNPATRPLNWNGANPVNWLLGQPKPSTGPGINVWNKAGATDLPSMRYGSNIA